MTAKKPKIKFADWRPSDQKVYISDTTNLRTKLNWDVRISVKEGLKKLTEWIKENESYFS
jgi:CDP-paratose 2-epimerase